ncbi:hypothetical protein DWX23_22435 [Parabacteroides sp. AF18-52]|uniref:hypothetical protein n=1 Tax=Parabacteroides sp. AF18-52 TaxID=2292242 RepID=UPI000EFE89D1|nr:hypothetical protein [Parabacteroides sp. AF18-52]RHR35981.1 hypothetical protein DWX23_22435 [Parabacteroides sp. AF18-52]
MREAGEVVSDPIKKAVQIANERVQKEHPDASNFSKYYNAAEKATVRKYNNLAKLEQAAKDAKKTELESCPIVGAEVKNTVINTDSTTFCNSLNGLKHCYAATRTPFNVYESKIGRSLLISEYTVKPLGSNYVKVGLSYDKETVDHYETCDKSEFKDEIDSSKV